MDGMKTWYQSKTVWGALIAVAASIAQMAGVDLAPDVQNDIADLAIALGGALGGALSIYGRISASTAIGRR
ncbi:hypothetical protein [Pseudorhizobium flavum]|uniref:Holin n=1 Tax=Pseudorhizobium flavum TaxID=1335061 RepID=A0A7W9Z1D2_9HYPH|nr:hypothetical protein [Pseudorhizobium flavum]MBB6180851.1 hypothetical protein [Pseudorhizobium flavum]CAD6602345.1 hypothetical protein RFYW14_01102 [Pseudorhizobium flavum]